MSYQVLARKWRPKSFADVVGQEHVLTILSNALSLGRVHHAYLFSGTRGVGKTSIARLLAKGLNCEQGITANPCGQCGNCQDIEQGRFVDLLEIDAASRTKVEDTREIIDNIQYLPTKGRFKVYLIDEVHMLSRSSFNALLKTLEEPPEHVKFLLATTDPHKLPITILSRCLHLHLSMLTNDLIAGQLVKILNVEKINLEDKAVRLLAKAANGSMRDALSLTDQAIALGNGKVETQSVSQMLGTLDKALPFSIIEALQQADGNALMQQIELAAKYGADWDNLLSETLSLLHQIALLQIVQGAMGDYNEYEDRLRYLAQYISPNDVQLFYQILLVGRKELAFAPDKRLGVEMSFLRALAFTPKPNKVNHVTSTASSSSSIPNTSTASIAPKAPVMQPKPQVQPEPQAPVQQPRSQEQSQQQTQEQQQQQQPKLDVETQVQPQSAPLPELQLEPSPLPIETAPDQPIENQTPKQDVTADLGSPSMTQNILAARQKLIENEAKIKKSNAVEGNQPEQEQEQLAKQSTKSTLAPKLNNNADESIHSNEKPQLLKSDNKAQPILPLSTPNVEEEETAETYQWQFSEHFVPANEGPTAKEIRQAFDHEKTPELVKRLIDEAAAIDAWSAEIEKLGLPPLVKQIAVNAFLEDVNESELTLHFRQPIAHLINIQANITKLAQAISRNRGKTIILNVIIDDDKTHLTPLEVRDQIYQNKLAEAKEQIKQDKNLQTICQLFDAQIDEASIRPV